MEAQLTIREKRMHQYRVWCYYSMPYLARPRFGKRVCGIDGNTYRALKFTAQSAHEISKRNEELVLLEMKDGFFQGVPARELPMRLKLRAGMENESPLVFVRMDND